MAKEPGHNGKAPYAEMPVTVEAAPKFDNNRPEFIVRQHGGKRFVFRLDDGTSANDKLKGGRTRLLWKPGSISVLDGTKDVTNPEDIRWFQDEIKKATEKDGKLREWVAPPKTPLT